MKRQNKFDDEGETVKFKNIAGTKTTLRTRPGKIDEKLDKIGQESENQ